MHRGDRSTIAAPNDAREVIRGKVDLRRRDRRCRQRVRPRCASSSRTSAASCAPASRSSRASARRPTLKRCCRIPRAALTRIDGKPTVFVMHDKNTVEPRAIESAPKTRSGSPSTMDWRGRARGARGHVRAQVRDLPLSLIATPCSTKLSQLRIQMRGAVVAAADHVDRRRRLSRRAHLPDRRHAGRLDRPGLGADRRAGGLSPVEVERTVTFPIENALNGVPGPVELRSMSRCGLSCGHGRVRRRHRHLVRAPAGARARARHRERAACRRRATPELAPLVERPRRDLSSSSCAPTSTRRCSCARCSTGRSCRSSAACPASSRSTRMGGDLKQYQVVVDPARLARARPDAERRHRRRSQRANINVGGGYIERGGESFTMRGAGMLTNERGHRATSSCAPTPDRPPVLVRHVAEVQVGAGAALRRHHARRRGRGGHRHRHDAARLEQPRRHPRREGADGRDRAGAAARRHDRRRSTTAPTSSGARCSTVGDEPGRGRADRHGRARAVARHAARRARRSCSASPRRWRSPSSACTCSASPAI